MYNVKSLNQDILQETFQVIRPIIVDKSVNRDLVRVKRLKCRNTLLNRDSTLDIQEKSLDCTILY